MPLSPEERQRLLMKAQAATQPQQQESGLPPEVQAVISQAPQVPSYIPSIRKGGVTITMAEPPQVGQRDLAMEKAKLLLKQRYQAPTETERERTPMAAGAVQYLDQFAQQLGLNPATGEMTGGEKLAKPFVREMVPQKFQDYTMSEDSSIAYNDLESAFQLGSIVLTGRQGDIGKLQQLREVYSFGGGIKDKPKLANQRYQNLRKLFQTFERAEAMPIEQRQKALDQASSQMDLMLNESGSGAASGGGRVKVVGPDGKQYTLPSNQIERAKKQGYQLAP